MRRSFLKQALVVFASGALFLPIAIDYGVTAQAANFSFSDNSCSSFTVTDNGGGNFTLNCVPAVAGQFSVSLSASIGAPTISQAVTLTATPQSAAGPVTYTWGSAPAGCPAITQQVATPSKADITAPGGQTAVGPCSYTLSASDGTNQANANRPVSWSTAGGGGGGGPLNCTGVSNSSTGATTITGQTLTIDIPWPNDTTTHQYVTDGFMPDGAVVFRFTTSGVANSSGNTGVIKGVEYQSAPAGRTGALSTQPCDFLGTSAFPKSGQGCGKTKFSNNSAPSIGLTQGSTVALCGAALQPNTTYYMNISNTNNNCNGPACTMIFYFQKAGGT